MNKFLKIMSLGVLLLLPVSPAHAQAPALSPIPNVSLNAGATMNVAVVAVDADGRPISITASLPTFATLNQPTVGNGVVVTTVTLAPTAAFIGDFSAAVTATAGGVSSVRVFQITINAAGSNQAPRVIAPPLQEVTAGTALMFPVTASDADGDAITSLSASGLPGGASFTPNGSNTSATFNWTPGVGDVGEYDVLFTAANALSGTGVTHLRVGSPPTLMITPIDDVTVADGGFLSVPVHASGVPGALITLAAALPSFGTLNPPGTGTNEVTTTISLTPPTGSAGTYHASVTAISLGASVTELFDIVVTGSSGGENHAPILTAPATKIIAAGSFLSFDVTAIDPDGDHVEMLGSALPPGSAFTDHGDDTGTFTWTPTVSQAGTYTASFSGLDHRGGSGSASTVITVTGGAPENHAPTVSAPSTEQVDEGASLSFNVTASDPDGDPVALSASSVPEGATFTDHGNNTGTFSWMPGSTQSGSHVVAFSGNDGHGATGTATTAITVNDVTPPNPGGEVPGRACLLGKFKTNKDATCFRVRAVNHSFDLRDVDLSSLRLTFHGQSIAALPGAHIDVRCKHGDGDDDGDDDDDDGDDDHDGHHVSGVQLEGGHHGDDRDDDHGHDDCGVSCDDEGDCDGHGNVHGHGHDNGNGHGTGNGHGHGFGDFGRGHGKHKDDCDTLGIHVCFSTKELISLFAKCALPCALVDADIRASLADGKTVVALFKDNGHHGDDGDKDHDKDKGKDKDKDGDKDKDKDKGKDGHDKGNCLNAELRPNPLNPNTQLSFAVSREGTVRVTVYDMQGRVVKKLLNEFRTTGQQMLLWDGSNEMNVRVPSGIYFVRILAPEGSVIERVTVLK